jgi:hypothetical protein
MAKLLLKVEGERFVIVEEGLRVIEGFEGPIRVVCIAGPKNSGKSLLLELVIGDRGVFMPQEVIPVPTQGVLIYDHVYEVGGQNVVILDTQGLEGNETDSHLLAVLYLLSSTFIFNTKGMIDEAALLYLKPSMDIADHLQSHPGNTDLESLQHTSPRFLWVLRDFPLSLADEDGNAISAKDYLENVLSMSQYKGRNAEDCESTRTALLTLFPDRDCVIFPRPVDNQVETVHMQGRELKPKFLSQVGKVKTSMISTCPAKKIFKQKYNGRLLTKMLRAYAEANNSHKPLDLSRTWKKILSDEYASLFDSVKLLYDKLKDVKVSLMPYEEPELINKLYQAKIKSLVLLRTAFVKDRSQTERLIEDFEVYYENDCRYTLEDNTSSSFEFNITLLDKAFCDIFANIDSNFYTERLEKLEEDWSKASMSFETQGRGPAKLAALKEFSEKHQHQRFSKFFRDMVVTYERNLEEAVRENAHSREQRQKAEEEARLLAASEEHVGAIIRDMEQNIGIKTAEGAPLHEVMRGILSWLRTKQDERSRLERDTRKMKDELDAINLQMSSKKKSCCLLI